MLSYAVTDRDQERLVAELDIACMMQPEPVATAPARQTRHWFGKVTKRATIRTRLASA